MIFFNPSKLFYPAPPEIPWSEVDLQLVEEYLAQNPIINEAVNINQDPVWFLKKLHHPIYQELYTKLAKDALMSDFLTEGKLELFDKNYLASFQKHQGYYKFCKPFFLEQFSNVFAQAYQARDQVLISKLLDFIRVFDEEDFTKAFSKAVNSISLDLNQLHRLEQKMVKGEINAPTFFNSVGKLLPSQILNDLPKYFEQQKTAFVEQLIESSIIIHNNNDFRLASKLLNPIDSLKLDEEVKAKYEEVKAVLHEFNFIKQLLIDNKSKIEYHEDQIQKLDSIAHRIEANTFRTEDKAFIAQNLFNKDRIENLPDHFYTFPKAYLDLLRVFSSNYWNLYQDYPKAKKFLELAQELPLNEDDRLIVERDLEILELKKQQQLLNQERQEKEKAPSNEEPKFSFLSLIIFTLLLALIIAFISKFISYEYPDFEISSRSINPSVKSQNEKTYDYKPIENSQNNGFVEQDSSTQRIQILRPETGYRPYNEYFNSYPERSIHQNEILLFNFSTTDIVICIYDIQTGLTIRNVYIRNGEQFLERGILNGEYRLKLMSGNLWSKNRTLMDENIEEAFSQDLEYAEPILPANRIEIYEINNSPMNLQFSIGNRERLDLKVRNISEENFFKK